MKVKTKFSALTLALALCGGALVGCGNNPGSSEPTKYHVSCSQDATKYTVVGLESTYEVGANVTFSVTEVNPEDYTVTGVTSDDVVVTTVSALNYKFTMPDKDVILTVTTKAVEKYSVTLDTDDVVAGKQVGFTLKLGATTKMVTVSAHEGETKAATYSDDKVTFNEAGTYHVDLYDEDSRKMAITNYAVEVRAQIPGEDPDHPTTSSAAFTWASTNLTPVTGESDANWGKKGYLSPKLYVTGKVISLDNDPVADKNASVTLEGGITTFHMGAAQSSGVDCAKIDVGSVVTIAGYLYCYRTATGVQFGKDAAKTGKSQFIALDNSQLDSIVLPGELRGMINKTAELTAKVRPYNDQTVEWVSSDPTVANVVADSEDSRKATVTFGAAVGTTTIKARIGDVFSNECTVKVSDKEQVFRPLAPSEISESESYYLVASDASGLIYGVDDVGASYYVKVSSDINEASMVKVVKQSSKYIIKLGDHYIGYSYSDGRHNIHRVDTITDTNIALFDLEADTLRLTLTGKDTSSTKVYINYYNGALRFSAATYSNPAFMVYGYADPVAVTKVTLSKSSLELKPNDESELTYELDPFYAVATEVVWDSTDTSVATVTDGKVEAKADGTAKISVTVNGVKSDDCTVTVSASTKAVTKVTSASDLVANGTFYLAASGTGFNKQLKAISMFGTNSVGEVVDYTDVPDKDLFALTLVAGSASGTFAFKTVNNKYLAWSSGNTLIESETLNANSSWTITIADGNANVVNSADSARKMRYNSSNPRICAYTSEQTPIQLWTLK